MGPVELGLGALEVLSTPGTGRVAAVYTRAAYLQLPGGLMALTSLEVPSGPIHLRSRIRFDGLAMDDRVTVSGSLLQAGPRLVDVSWGTVWRGPVPTAGELRLGRGLAVELIHKMPPSSLCDAQVSHEVTEHVRNGDIPRLAGRLGGLGLGLTPAGDDCLAGVLLVARMLWGQSQEPILVDAVDMVQTNEIARMFLRWAARGQSIEPVHQFLMHAATGERQRAAEALDSLLALGASSGADLALGLRFGLELLPIRERVRLQTL